MPVVASEDGNRRWIDTDTDFDRHASDVKAMGEKNALSEHALVTCSELDLGDGETVAKVERSIHVRKWKIAKPFGILLGDLCGRKGSKIRWGRSVDFEKMF